MKEQIREMNDEMSKAQLLLMQEKSAHSSIKESYSKERKEHAQTKQGLQHREAELATAEEKAASLAEEVTALQIKLQKADEALPNPDTEQSEMQDLLEKLKKEAQEDHEELARVKPFERQCEAAEANAEQLQKELNRIKELMQKQTKDIFSLQESEMTRAVERGEVDQIARSDEDKATRIRSLQNEMDGMHKQSAQAQMRLEQAEGTIRSLEEELAALQTTMKSTDEDFAKRKALVEAEHEEIHALELWKLET